MNKRKIYLVTIALLLIIAAISSGAYFFNKENTVSGSVASNSVKSVTLTSITYNNLASELSGNAMVKALPEDTSILLRFYNFNTGQRQWEQSFTLEKGKVTRGGTEGDIVLSLHSKYLSGLTNQNLCSVIQKANSAGDLGFETELSKASLLWKFKSVLEYKSCFGL